MDYGTAHLLPTLELMNEQVGRLVEMCWTLVEANHKGKRLPDATLVLCAEQLRSLDDQRQRMNKMSDGVWQMISQTGNVS